MLAPRRSPATVFVAAAFLAALTLAPLVAASAPVTLDDVLALLKAGVGESLILKQIGYGAPAFKIGVQETLRLKEAGASDRLIESLMGKAVRAESRPASYTPGSVPSSFRVMKETTADGEEILHVTNLDASGKRIGGEIRHAPETSAPPARDAAEYRGSPEAPSAPVIVNIYQPPPPVQGGYTEGYSSPYMYRDPYAANYPGGILPGYYPRVYGYGGFRYGGYRGGCSWPAGGQHPSMRPAPAPRHIAEPVYSPIGPATGFDLYYQHTKDTLRR